MGHRASQRQRGVGLVEALIGFLVLSLGLAAAVQLQASLRRSADLARQRTEAVQLAQQDIEQLRGFATPLAFEQLADSRQTLAGSTTTFALVRSIAADPSASLKTATVNVAWIDRSGQPHAVQLGASLGGPSPAYSGILAVASDDPAVSRPFGRAGGIPWNARVLGDGRSADKPATASGLMFVFDHATGLLTGLCQNVSPALSTRELDAAALGACESVRGVVLTGHIRFSLGPQVDAADANDPPLPLAMTLALDAGSAAQSHCASEARKTVRIASGNLSRTEVVALATTPADLGLPAWADLGERWVAYTCAVISPAATGWSGRASVLPAGWAFGDTAGAYKLCRYSADHDGSGAIDRNDEHPARYTGVKGHLAQQNYLVIRGELACPGGPAPQALTAQHQP